VHPPGAQHQPISFISICFPKWLEESNRVGEE
jgi:hypothetical protein